MCTQHFSTLQVSNQ